MEVGKTAGMMILLCGIAFMFCGAYLRLNIVYPPPEFSNPVSVVGLTEKGGKYIEFNRGGISEDGSIFVNNDVTEDVLVFIDNVQINRGSGTYSGFGEKISMRIVYENKYISFENIITPAGIQIYGGLSDKHIGFVVSSDLIDNNVDNFYFNLIVPSYSVIENENFVYSENRELDATTFKIAKTKDKCIGLMVYEGNYPITAEDCKLEGWIKSNGNMYISMIGDSCCPDIETVDNGFKFYLVSEMEDFENVYQNGKIITTAEGYLTLVFDILIYLPDEYWCWGYIGVPVIMTTVFPAEVEEIVLSDISTYMLVTGLILSLFGGGIMYVSKGVAVGR